MENDKEIIKRILKGDMEQYNLLIKKYDKKVYNFILTFVKKQHTAEDLTQITFIKAYENMNKFNVNKNFFTWILTIAKNSTLNEIKKQNREVALTNSSYLQELHVRKFKELDPQNMYESKIDSLNVYNLIESLPYKYKTLIVLKYIQGLNYKQISEELDISVSKVESRLHTARKKLIDKLNKFNSKEVGVCNKWIAECRKNI